MLHSPFIVVLRVSNTIANMLSKFAKKQFAKRDWGKGEAAAKKIYDFTHKNEEAFKAASEERKMIGSTKRTSFGGELILFMITTETNLKTDHRRK